MDSFLAWHPAAAGSIFGVPAGLLLLVVKWTVKKPTLGEL